MTPAALLARVTGSVSYLRISSRRDADDGLRWLPCEPLVRDPSRLLVVARSTAAGRGTGRDDIAMSLFVQAYAFRVASASIGSWLLSGAGDDAVAFDVGSANTMFSIARHRPNALVLSSVRFAADDVWSATFDRHLSPLVATAHDALAAGGDRRVGEPLLWSNVAAGCGSAFGAFHGNLDDRAFVRQAAERFWERAPAEVRRGGRFVEFAGAASEPGWFFERSACCLLYRIPPSEPGAEPTMCEDCPLWSDDERTARYVAATSIGDEGDRR